MMFKGLHQALQKQPKPVDSKRGPQVIPVQSAQTLLAPEKRQLHLKNIRALLNLPPQLYDTLYYKTIERFAEFVQHLPHTQHGAFSASGGFLDHGIERAARALSLCLNYFFPEEKNFQSIGSHEALWVYAVFTAALFLDLGRIAVKYQVSLCQRDGTISKEWSAYAGSMNKHGDYYKYDFIKENRDHLGRMVTGLLARQLLNEASGADSEEGGGFNWLASNPDVLEAWLNMLTSQGRPVGTLLTVIPIADAQVIEAHLAIKNPHLFAGSMFDAKTPSGEEGLLALTTAEAEAFLHWLRTGLADGSISVNQADSNVHITPEGVLLDSKIFKEFSEKNAAQVEQQVNKLLESYVTTDSEVIKRSESERGGLLSAIGGTSAEALQRYLLINNPSLLFAAGQVPGNSGRLVVVSAQKTAQQQIPLNQKMNPNAQLQHR